MPLVATFKPQFGAVAKFLLDDPAAPKDRYIHSSGIMY
jgi:hypothetical protein